MTEGTKADQAAGKHLSIPAIALRGDLSEEINLSKPQFSLMWSGNKISAKLRRL